MNPPEDTDPNEQEHEDHTDDLLPEDRYENVIRMPARGPKDLVIDPDTMDIIW